MTPSQLAFVGCLGAALALHLAGRAFRTQARQVLGVASEADAHRLSEMEPRAARALARAAWCHRASLAALVALPVVALLARLAPVP